MRILIVWPHSGRNAGDRALVEEACRLARRRYPGAAVAVCLNDPAGWLGPAPAEIIPSLKTWLAEVNPAGEQTWRKGRLPWAALRLLLAVIVFRLTGRGWRFGSPAQRLLLERYYAADLVLGSGGNHLYARHRFNLTFFWTWLSLALAPMLGKRVIILPQSIGPLHGPLQRRLVRWLLDRAELAMVREPVSLRFAHELWPRRLPVLRPDMAFGFAGDPPAVGAELLRAAGRDPSRPLIGFALMDWGAQEPAFRGQAAHERALADALRRCVAELGAQVVLVSQCCGPAAPQDDRIVARRIMAASGLAPADALILDAELDAGRLKAVYGQLDLLIATRLHAAIFALGAGVPTALISYLPKGRGVMEMLGLDAWCLDIGEAGGPALWGLIERAWAGRAALRAAISLSRRALALDALEADLPPAPRPTIMQFVTGAAIGGELGGAEQYGIQLARQLAARGFEVLVCGFWRFDSPSERRWVELLRGEGIAVRLLVAPTGGALRDVGLAALRYLRLVRAERPLLVNSHFERGDLLGLLAGMLLRRPPLLVRTMHAPEQWQRRPWLGALLNLWWLPRRFAAEIAISGDTRQALDRRPAARLLGKTATVIRNGIEAAWFDPPAPGPPPHPEDLRLPPGRPLIAAIGRLDERKGYRYLIEAAAAVRRVFPGAAFAIIGEGELRPDLERRIAALGLDGVVRLLGSRLDVPALLPHVDIVVSAGLWEGMPTALIEAMARKVPVIATTVSHELICHGATGALVPPGDALALAQALIALLGNPERRQSMAEAAQRRARAWTIERAADRYADLYRRLLAGEPDVPAADPEPMGAAA